MSHGVRKVYKYPNVLLYCDNMGREELIETILKAKEHNTTLYHKTLKNADGSLRRYKITSLKTWKTRDDILIGLKRGLYEYHKINKYDLITWFTFYEPTIKNKA